MTRHKQYPFTDPEGVHGVVLSTTRFLGEDREKLVRLDDGQEIVVPRELLQPRDDNSYYLTVPIRGLLRSESGRDSGGSETVIPALEERVVVDRQSVETGRLRIRKHVEETETTVDEPLLQNTWDVERIAINRILTGEPPEPRYEGDTLVLPVLEEVLVVEKRLILREEMRVTRRSLETRDPQTHSVRTERIDVERVS